MCFQKALGSNMARQACSLSRALSNLSTPPVISQTENLLSDHGCIILSQPCIKQGLPMLSHYLTLE